VAGVPSVIINLASEDFGLVEGGELGIPFAHTSDVSVNGVNGDVFDPVDLDWVDNITSGNLEEVMTVFVVVIFGVVSNAFSFPIADHSSHLCISDHEALVIELSVPAFVELFRADRNAGLSGNADLGTDISPAVVLALKREISVGEVSTLIKKFPVLVVILVVKGIKFFIVADAKAVIVVVALKVILCRGTVKVVVLKVELLLATVNTLNRKFVKCYDILV